MNKLQRNRFYVDIKRDILVKSVNLIDYLLKLRDLYLKTYNTFTVTQIQLTMPLRSFSCFLLLWFSD